MIFFGVWTRSSCGLEDERNEVDVWVSVEFALSSSFGHKSAAQTKDGLQEKRATIETSKNVTELLKTRSIRACSVCPLTTQERAGTSCSMNTLTPLCD